jgi:hypothetical protein
MSHSFVALAVAVLSLFVATPSRAQLERPFSADFAVGTSNGWGGHYSDRSSVAWELTLVPEHAATRLLAVTLGGQGAFASGDVCALAAGPGSNCLSRFPSTLHVGILGGLEGHARAFTFRALAGPAVFAGTGSPGIGAQAQLAASVDASSHLSMVVAAQAGLARRLSGETHGLGGVTFGVRVR